MTQLADATLTEITSEAELREVLGGLPTGRA